MIPAGLNYSGVRVVRARPPVSQDGRRIHAAIRNATVQRAFSGLGASEKACRVYESFSNAASSLSSEFGGSYGAIANVAGDLINGIVSATACQQDTPEASDTPTPPVDSGNAALQQALVQQQQQFQMLLAQQQAQQAQAQAQASDGKILGLTKDQLLIGGIAGGVLLFLLLRR